MCFFHMGIAQVNDKDKDKESDLVILVVQLTIPDKFGNSNHSIEG